MTPREHKILIILVIIFTLALLSAGLIFIFRDRLTRTGDFETPALDSSARTGFPSDLSADLSYTKMTAREDYAIFLCATPRLDGDLLTLYFTSPPSNTALLKFRVFSSDGTLLAESGLLEPASYLESIRLDHLPPAAESVTLKVMSYTRDTYLSDGAFSLALPLTRASL